jgi:hypothetical protein
MSDADGHLTPTSTASTYQILAFVFSRLAVAGWTVELCGLGVAHLGLDLDALLEVQSVEGLG